MCHKILSEKEIGYANSITIFQGFLETIPHKHRKDSKTASQMGNNSNRKQNCEIHIIIQIKYSTLKPCIQLVT